MLRNYTKQTLDGYKKRFPLLSTDEILIEIKKYEERFISSGILKVVSSDHHKYLKGWLMRAQENKERRE